MSAWAPRATASAAAALAAFAVFAGGSASRSEPAPPPGVAPVVRSDSASACEGGRIVSVEIRPHNIYDPVPPGRLSRFYRAANRLHIRTRPGTIREQLLFEPGDVYRDERREESLRTLRSLEYLEPLSIEPTCSGDSVSLLVETRDSWTTSPEFNLERGGGKQFGSFGIAERNLFGLGKSYSLAYHEDPTGVSRSFSYGDPGVLGTHHRLNYSAAAGTAGSTDVLSLALPFYALDSPWSYGSAWRRGSSVLHLFANGGEIATLDQRISEVEVWGGRGGRHGGTVSRQVLSFLARDRALGPSRLDPGAPPEFDGGEESLSLRVIALEATRWHPRYIERNGVERIGRVEDYDVGHTFALRLGIAPHVLGSTADEGYVRARAEAGADTRFGFGQVRASVSTRLRRSPVEVIRGLDARWVSPTGHGHALVLAARGVAGSRVARDFQVVVGGLSGLRAYPVQAVAGRELIRFNVEQRWLLSPNIADLAALGVAGFYDAARAWGPGAAGTGWFNDAGFGLRIVSPRSALGPALRVDIAWPMSPTRDGQRQPVFSFGSSQAF